MRPRIDRTGNTYGFLSVLGLVGKNHHNQYLWRCRCVCGKEINVPTHNLTTGNTRSCGCKRHEPSHWRNKERNQHNVPEWLGVSKD